MLKNSFILKVKSTIIQKFQHTIIFFNKFNQLIILTSSLKKPHTQTHNVQTLEMGKVLVIEDGLMTDIFAGFEYFL